MNNLLNLPRIKRSPAEPEPNTIGNRRKVQTDHKAPHRPLVVDL
jgi:hypothetical protein